MPTHRVRFNPVLGVILLLVGLANLALALGRSDLAPGLLLGVVMGLLGVMYLVGTNVVVRPDTLQVLAPVQVVKRAHPIGGLSDLRMDGNKVVRVSDGRRLANLGLFACRRDDVESLRQAIAAAHVAAPVEPTS